MLCSTRRLEINGIEIQIQEPKYYVPHERKRYAPTDALVKTWIMVRIRLQTDSNSKARWEAAKGKYL